MSVTLDTLKRPDVPAEREAIAGVVPPSGLLAVIGNWDPMPVTKISCAYEGELTAIVSRSARAQDPAMRRRVCILLIVAIASLQGVSGFA